jgi:plasmid stabilization system protein ParE
MNKLIKFSEFAKEDILDAFNWYETKNENLGDKFIQDFKSTLNFIQKNPLQFQKIYKVTRIAYFQTFKFGIYYSIHKTEILIRRVLHNNRNPKEWKKDF